MYKSCRRISIWSFLDTDLDGIKDVDETVLNTTVKCTGYEYLYLADNGVTIRAKPGAESGKEYVLNGISYLVVEDKDDLLAEYNNGGGRDMATVVTTRVTNMQSLFSYETSFNDDISSWDTSNVTNMNYTFTGASSFNYDISSWDTSSVITMEYMFGEARLFNINIGSWDTSSVTNMYGMFRNADVFNRDISGWDTSNMTDMRLMFVDALQFNQNLVGWNVSNVIKCSDFSLRAPLIQANKPLFINNCTAN